ncbi:MAG: sulfatase-like hydrolase/transferase [Acidimicrobiales bacterium]
MDETDAWDNTVVIFTADHGDQCGSHGLRSKGPWNYEETMRIPLYVVAPGITSPGSVTDAMMSPVDLAATICELGGINQMKLIYLAGRCSPFGKTHRLTVETMFCLPKTGRGMTAC